MANHLSGEGLRQVMEVVKTSGHADRLRALAGIDRVDRARLVRYYTAFVLEVQSRRVQVIGCTPYPDEAVVIRCLR